MWYRTSFWRLFSSTVFMFSLLVGGQPALVSAGCGCQKTPPPSSVIFPNATYSGMPVTLIHSALQEGQSYTVTFTSGATGATATVQAQAVTKRDISDSQYKPQLVVATPALPLGPVSIHVSEAGQQAVLLFVDDMNFTVVPQPVVIAEQIGKFDFRDFQAAVSREGVFYLSLDLSALKDPKVLQAQAKGYPLRFGSSDVVFYNTQGFVMQHLDAGIPGLFSLRPPQTLSTDSDILVYSRHEFNSFFLQHGERQNHQLDPYDANWHLDGTLHIDHDHLILAITGALPNGALPSPGATPAFKLEIRTDSLFTYGVTGAESVKLSGRARTDSYRSSKSAAGSYGISGDLLSNGEISLSDNAVVWGNGHGRAVRVSGKAKLEGNKIISSTPVELLPVYLPNGLENLGSIVLSDQKQQLTLAGPASYQVTDLIVKDGGSLFIDNSTGPVTLYVTGQVQIKERGAILPADTNPEQFALYVVNGGKVTLEGNESFHGVLYAPSSWVDIAGNTQVFGAVVASQTTMRDNATVHYDVDLRKKDTASDPISGGGKKKK